MKIIAKVKTKTKEDSIVRVNQPELKLGGRETLPQYIISVKAEPVDGKANEAIIKLLADYFDVSKSSITLISGQSSKQKVFEIK